MINALFEKCVRAVAEEKGTAVDSKSTQNKKKSSHREIFDNA